MWQRAQHAKKRFGAPSTIVATDQPVGLASLAERLSAGEAPSAGASLSARALRRMAS